MSKQIKQTSGGRLHALHAALMAAEPVVSASVNLKPTIETKRGRDANAPSRGPMSLDLDEEIPSALVVKSEMMHYLAGVTMRAFTKDGFIQKKAYRRIHDMLLDRGTNVPSCTSPSDFHESETDWSSACPSPKDSPSQTRRGSLTGTIHPNAIKNNSTLFAQLFWTIRRHYPSEITLESAIEVLRALRFFGKFLLLSYPCDRPIALS